MVRAARRQDHDKVYSALIAALHALRDWLPREEAIFMGACFPPLLRGLYYEGWHVTGHPPTKSRRAFLERIHDGEHREPDAEQVAWPFSRRVCQQPSSRMLKPPRLKNCIVCGRAEHKRLVENMSAALEPNSCARQIIRVFLGGDVMTGRGIDQIMPRPCDPQLYEDWVQSASDYVRLAERVNGNSDTCGADLRLGRGFGAVESSAA